MSPAPTHDRGTPQHLDDAKTVEFLSRGIAILTAYSRGFISAEEARTRMDQATRTLLRPEDGT